MTGDAAVNPWAKIMGPCYTVTSMAQTFGGPRAKFLEAGETLRLLALETDDKATLYPAFQLHDGQVVQGLSDILAVLQTGTSSRWTWAQWLTTALPDEDPPRAIDSPWAGRLDEVLSGAKHDTWAWSS